MHNDAVCSGFTQIHHRRGELQDVDARRARPITLGGEVVEYRLGTQRKVRSRNRDAQDTVAGSSKHRVRATFLRESDQRECRSYRCPPGLDWMCIADAMERRSSTQTPGAWPDSLSVTLHSNDGDRDEVWSMMPGPTRSKQPGAANWCPHYRHSQRNLQDCCQKRRSHQASPGQPEYCRRKRRAASSHPCLEHGTP
jgi:hypothetical protein